MVHLQKEDSRLAATPLRPIAVATLHNGFEPSGGELWVSNDTKHGGWPSFGLLSGIKPGSRGWLWSGRAGSNNGTEIDLF